MAPRARTGPTGPGSAEPSDAQVANAFRGLGGTGGPSARVRHRARRRRIDLLAVGALALFTVTLWAVTVVHVRDLLIKGSAARTIGDWPPALETAGFALLALAGTSYTLRRWAAIPPAIPSSSSPLASPPAGVRERPRTATGGSATDAPVRSERS